ncbi:MAG: L-rhamnose mutarotase [Beijerinckiaceae bacterium]
MKRIAFKLKLRPGRLAEYTRRHDEIWPEMASLIRASGVSDFRIWHDPDTDFLFCSQLREDDARADLIRSEALWRRWQADMAEFLVTRPDGLPQRWPLNQVFHLP